MLKKKPVVTGKMIDTIFAKTGKSIATSKGLKIVQSIIGEEVEEILTDLVTPIWEHWTYDHRSLGEIYADEVSLSSLAETFTWANAVQANSIYINKVNSFFISLCPVSEEPHQCCHVVLVCAYADIIYPAAQEGIL